MRWQLCERTSYQETRNDIGSGNKEMAQTGNLNAIIKAQDQGCKGGELERVCMDWAA